MKAKLVIEIDGETHGSEAEIAHDRRRDAFLKTNGWRVIRVTNEEVYKNLNNLLEMLYHQATAPTDL